MRFLIDNALSPIVAEGLRQAGHDAVYVCERQMQRAPDADIFAWTAQDDRVIVSADTDFGALLALRNSAKPSFILFRRDWHPPTRQAGAIVANLPQLERHLLEGAVVTFDRQRVRVRSLPISR